MEHSPQLPNKGPSYVWTDVNYQPCNFLPGISILKSHFVLIYLESVLEYNIGKFGTQKDLIYGTIKCGQTRWKLRLRGGKRNVVSIA
jgi:hypothetical protein